MERKTSYFGGLLPGFGSDGTLSCPMCDFSYLHQKAVEIWNRDEDAKIDGVRVSENSEVGKAVGTNPSPRRDGVSISFSCEGCGHIGELVIAQHKGQTVMEWR